MTDLFVYFLQGLQVVLVIFVAFYLYYDWKLGAAPVPSSTAAVRKVAEILPQFSGKNVADLGSGWGGMAFAAARACPDKTVTGIEFAPMPYAWSRLRQLFSGKLGNLRFLRTDLFAYDFGGIDIAFCYMPPEIMPRLAPKLREMPKGAVIISNSAPAEGMQPEQVHDVKGLLPEKIYIYRVA